MGDSSGVRRLWLPSVDAHGRSVVTRGASTLGLFPKIIMRPFRLALLLVVACAMAVPSAAPQFWRAATLADFVKGDLDQVSIDEQGRLALGPAIDRVFDTGAPFVWTAVRGQDGVVYLGTGNDGKVFKIDALVEASLFYDAPELEVHALLPAPDGGLYVATSPDGRVYKRGPERGCAAVLRS